MSGGLRHHNDEGNGPSHAVGYKRTYALELRRGAWPEETIPLGTLRILS